MAQLITIKDIVKNHNLSYQMVNHYTRMGLLTVVERKGYKRLYDKQETEKHLKTIIELKNQGYTLPLIRDQFIKENPGRSGRG